ncbi:MAG: hypothetical protein ACI825_000379 [Planctomycetota bacterium]|jgi:hypothetical protein
MIISVSNSYVHKALIAKKVEFNQDAMKKVILDTAAKVGLDSNSIYINRLGHIELKKPNSLKLHSLTLEMEKMGFDLKLTRQTTIEIC